MPMNANWRYTYLLEQDFTRTNFIRRKKINIWDDLKYLNISREVDSDVRGNWFSCKIIILFV